MIRTERRFVSESTLYLLQLTSRTGLAIVFGAICALVIAQPTPSRAQDSVSGGLLSLEKYWDYEEADNPQISPDGAQVIYTRSRFDKQIDKRARELWIVNSDGSRHRFLANGSDAQWSPDGTRIAYTAKGDADKPQIFVRWMDAEGAVSQITHADRPPRNIQWSPDGRSIAFRSVVPSRNNWKIDMPPKPKGAKWAEAPRIVEKLHFRQDRVGFQPDGYNHLFVVAADGGSARQITSGDWHVGRRRAGLDGGVGLDWTPDGGSLVFDGITGDDTNRYFESHINIVSVDTGEIRKLTATRGVWVNPVVSADGRSLLYTGHTKIDQTWAAGEIWVMGIDGSDSRQLTQDSSDTPGSVKWARDGKGAYYGLRHHGSQNVHYVSLRGEMRAVTEGEHVLSVASVSDGTIAVGTVTSPTRPKDVALVDLRRPKTIRRLTDLNADLLHGVTVVDYEEIWYDSEDGTKVQGWIIKPPDFDADGKYPLMLVIHGGPHAMYDLRFRYGWQNYAANGYVLLVTNPRGSTGYGTDFGNAVNHDYPGMKDYADLMGGVDAIVERGYVDTDRMYIEGCSGGGILTLWSIAHTDRFAAATSRCPVTDWISIVGTTDMSARAFSQFEVPFWEDPAPWIRRSPLFHVGKVSTPTMLMTGVRDARTPIGQAEQYYAALKLRGVPARLVRMNDEWHGTGRVRPTNFMRTQLYIMSWQEMWTKSGRIAEHVE